MFPRIDYLSWIEGRPAAAAHDLGSSDLRPVTGGTVVPDVLEGFSDPGSRTLEGHLAEVFDVTEAEVLVTPGATTANLVAVAASLPGSILVEKPAYEPLVVSPEGLDATVHRFVRPSEHGWPLDPDRVAAAALEDTSLVVVTNRHNPSGTLTDRETLAEAASAAADAGARLLVDEVYAAYGDDGAPASADEGGVAFGGPTAAGLEDAVVTGSLTKFHGLGGLRVGWLVGDEPFVERATEVAQHFPAVAEPSRALGRRALANVDALTERSHDLAAENADRLRSFVDGRDDVDSSVPDSCPFGLLFHETADGDEVSRAAWEEGLLVVPGRFFGVDEGVRVSLGRDPNAMADALDVFGSVLEDL